MRTSLVVLTVFLGSAVTAMAAPQGYSSQYSDNGSGSSGYSNGGVDDPNTDYYEYPPGSGQYYAYGSSPNGDPSSPGTDSYDSPTNDGTDDNNYDDPSGNGYDDPSEEPWYYSNNTTEAQPVKAPHNNKAFSKGQTAGIAVGAGVAGLGLGALAMAAIKKVASHPVKRREEMEPLIVSMQQE